MKKLSQWVGRAAIVPSIALIPRAAHAETSTEAPDSPAQGPGQRGTVQQARPTLDEKLRYPTLTLKTKHTAELAVAQAMRALTRDDAERHARGETVTDQGHAPIAMVFDPPTAVEPPLLILGGMGPLAGLQTFQQVLARADGMRRIVLLQATQVPDRTGVLLAKDGARELHEKVVDRLARAIGAGLRLASPGGSPVDMIVACNTAHAFVPEALERVHSDDLHWRSYVDAVASGVPRSNDPVLILATTGTQAAGLYRQAFGAHGVPWMEPDAEGQALLMKAIYSVKGGDEPSAVQSGQAAMRGLMSGGQRPGRVLAGCTEVPLLLELLKTQATPEVQGFVSSLEVIDPLLVALEQDATRHGKASFVAAEDALWAPSDSERTWRSLWTLPRTDAFAWGVPVTFARPRGSAVATHRLLPPKAPNSPRL